MSRTSAVGAVEFATESAWGEVSSTFGSRLAVLGQVDVTGLTQSKTDPERTVQYLQDGTMPIRGVKGGTFKTDVWIPGHGSSTASGTPSLATHETLLGYVFGNATAGGAATTGSGGTASAVTTAAASGLTAGQIVFGGLKGDGRADAQAGVVSTHSASTMSLLTAFPAAMSGTDQICSAVMLYGPNAASTAAVQAMRFRALTANQQYAMHGCFPQSVELSGFDNGGLPRASVTWGVSWWEPVSATFPSATAVDAFNPAPCAGGSLFVQSNGTATRQVYSARSLTISYNLGVTPLMGPGGVDSNQTIVGAVRSPEVVTVSFEVDAQTASASPTWPGRWDSDTQFYHLLYTCNSAASGKQVAIYLPNCCIVDRKPTQQGGGVNRERVTMRAYTGTVTTSEMTLSACRIGLG